LALKLSGFHRGKLPGNERMANASHSDAVNVSRHVVQGREAVVSGELIRIRHGPLGTVAGVFPRRYFLPPALSN
jgi:hypothetical protein